MIKQLRFNGTINDLPNGFVIFELYTTIFTVMWVLLGIDMNSQNFAHSINPFTMCGFDAYIIILPFNATKTLKAG